MLSHRVREKEDEKVNPSEASRVGVNGSGLTQSASALLRRKPLEKAP